MTFNCPECNAILSFPNLVEKFDCFICPECNKNISDYISNLKKDMVNHPPHYNAHPSGVECIDITEHMNFCVGNAVKYLWRADLKGKSIEDLEKARWYLDREIQRRKRV